VKIGSFRNGYVRCLAVMEIWNEATGVRRGMKKPISLETEQFGWHDNALWHKGSRTARHVAGWNPRGKRMHSRPTNTPKGGITDSTQKRNLKVG
jgi:hypothetical protein